MWKPDTNGDHSVKSFCLYLGKLDVLNEQLILAKIWLGCAPPKVELFMWLAL